MVSRICFQYSEIIQDAEVCAMACFHKIKNRPPGPTFLALKHGEAGILRIRQFISRGVADLMWAQRDRKIPVDLCVVGIRFRMLLVGMPVREFTLYGPEITIADARRL